MEETLFELENRQTKDEIAGFLRKVAEKFESGEELVLRSGSNREEVEIPETCNFEVKLEREEEEMSLEFELEWMPSSGSESENLRID